MGTFGIIEKKKLFLINGAFDSVVKMCIELNMGKKIPKSLT